MLPERSPRRNVCGLFDMTRGEARRDTTLSLVRSWAWGLTIRVRPRARTRRPQVEIEDRALPAASAATTGERDTQHPETAAGMLGLRGSGSWPARSSRVSCRCR